jgi:hypothetical protein
MSLLVLSFFVLAPLVRASTGAIYTTNSACSGVNVNLYNAKTDVYLDGGPQGGGSGLPDGNYYVQVTTPSGTVLGKTSTNSVVVSGGEFAQCYQLSVILNSASSGFTTPGYDDTTNNGGEYKVWASLDPTFANGTNKTDNFKVKGSNQQPQFGSIAGMKFEDMNGNGSKDGGDSGLSGWTIFIDENNDGLMDLGEQRTTTDGSGNYSFTGLLAGTYRLCEVGQAGWTQTTPGGDGCQLVVVAAGQNVTGIDFGNFHNVTISGYKWHDKDSSQTLNNSEPKLSGWTIAIGHNGATTTAVTDGSGNYSFGNLGPGTYTLCEVLKIGWVQTYPSNTGNGCHVITAQSGHNVTANFGNHALYWCSPGFWMTAITKNRTGVLTYLSGHGVNLNTLYNTIGGAPLKAGSPANPTVSTVLLGPSIYGGPAFNSVANWIAGILGWQGTQSTGENCPLDAQGRWTAI